MAITSTSTDSEIEAAYIDNVVAADAYDVAAAAICLQAIRTFRFKNPQSGTFAGRAYTMAQWDKEIERLTSVLDSARFGPAPLSGRSRRIRMRPDGPGGYL